MVTAKLHGKGGWGRQNIFAAATATYFAGREKWQHIGKFEYQQIIERWGGVLVFLYWNRFSNKKKYVIKNHLLIIVSEDT